MTTPVPPHMQDIVHHDRYLWLLKYLKRDATFQEKHLHPVQIGSLATPTTRVLITDFPLNGLNNINSLPSTVRCDGLENLRDQLNHGPEERQGRLIFVSTVSGVGPEKRFMQLHSLSGSQFKTTPSPANEAPVITWPRTAGLLGVHPIKGHISALPDVGVLDLVLEHFDLGADVLLRYLDQNAHLAYRVQTLEQLPLANYASKQSLRREIRVGIDQANHFTVIMDQPEEDGPWTILMLASEDDCLGIDFNNISPLQQPIRESMDSPSYDFETKLACLTKDDVTIILKTPLSLVSLYSSSLASSFAAHIPLYQRNWTIAYEPYANTSVVYGYAYHRDAVRQLAKRYATHLRYINHTLDGLRRLSPAHPDPNSLSHVPGLDALIADFEHFRHEISALKTNCDQFLEQQVSKLALQDARTSLREARDLKRISYMAFIFVPLSLTSSFFGMNVRELDSGSTPLWVFIVTAIAILLSSILIVGISGSKWFETLGKAISSCFGGIKQKLFPPKRPASTKPATAINPYTDLLPIPPLSNTVPTPKPAGNWRFWRKAKWDPENTYHLLDAPYYPTTYADPDEFHYRPSPELSSRRPNPPMFSVYADPEPHRIDLYDDGNAPWDVNGVETEYGAAWRGTTNRVVNRQRYMPYRPVVDL